MKEKKFKALVRINFESIFVSMKDRSDAKAKQFPIMSLTQNRSSNDVIDFGGGTKKRKQKDARKWNLEIS